jgi:transcriptional regulator with XRE-family HTH domain
MGKDVETYAAELRAAFGRHSRRARQDMDLSQRDFAERVGLDQKIISATELRQRNLTLSTMVRVSQVLGIPVPAMLQPYRTLSGGGAG